MSATENHKPEIKNKKPATKKQHIALGKSGEDFAVAYLEYKGYNILERNFRFNHKEIDIIAEKDQTLIFIEVKTRRNLKTGFPEENVDNTKINRLVQAAENYIEYHQTPPEIRFDVISLVKHDDSFKLFHFKDLEL